MREDCFSKFSTDFKIERKRDAGLLTMHFPFRHISLDPDLHGVPSSTVGLNLLVTF